MWWTVVADAAPVSPGSAVVEASGERSALFSIGEFGRFSVVARSPQGTALRVEDRMAGVLARDGVPGTADGRVDLFLDRGPIKVVAESADAGEGKAEIVVRPFVLAGEALALRPTVPVESELRDLEVRAWWVDVPEGGEVSIEGVGRHLGDLRLWRDGVWLVDAEPTCRTLEPVAGAPWTDCVVAATVEPGVYLLTAYGGVGQPWTTDSDAAPLQVQWGTPTLASAGTQGMVVPNAGFVRVRFPEGVDTAAVALADVTPFRMLGGSGGDARITMESRRPTAWTRTVAGATLTLEGVPGQAFTLTWFHQGTTITVPRNGAWFVGSVSTSHPLDVLAPTAVAAMRVPPTNEWAITARQALPLSRGVAYREPFDAKGTRRLVEVTEAGPYVFAVEGGEGAFVRVYPYFLEPPKGFVFPKAETSVSVDLAVGLHLVEITGAGGVGAATMAYDSLAARAARAMGGGPKPEVVRPVVQFPALALTPQHQVTLFGPSAGFSGLFARELPLDPTDALPVTFLPSEVVELSVRVKERGALTLTSAEGDPFPLSVGGGGMTTEADLPPGDHVVRLVNPRSALASAVLLFVPASRDRALRPLDPERAATLDAFPRLRVDRPVGVDLVDGVPRTVRVTIDEPGLWTVESTGLLATTGTLRTRTQPSLLQASQDGDGRNFQIARFLRPGDYQLTAVAEGESAGHAGLKLRRGVVRDGGVIADDTPARITLKAGEAARYAITVARAGDYHVAHGGRSRVFDCRLEDRDGWTVTPSPDQLCSFVVHLEPGTYTLIGLPDRVETRRHTQVTVADPAEVVRTGHGPFPLALSSAHHAVWTEPRQAAERPVDVWEGAMPAAGAASVWLSPEMVGVIRSGDRVVATVTGGSFTGELPAGPFRVEVRSVRPGTGVPYTLTVQPEALVAGARRTVGFGETLPVVVGAAGVYTLESDGDVDVRARLTDERGRIVASNDDRPDDWNFRISARLDPGRYLLRVTRVDGVAGRSPRRGEAYDAEGYEVYEGEAPDVEASTVDVAMRAPAEVAGPALRDGVATKLRPGRDAHLLLVEKAGRPDVIVATAAAAENVGVAIELQDGASWRSVAVGTGTRAVAVARANGAPARIRVWSEDGRGGEVTVVASALGSKRGGGSVALGRGWGAVAFGGGAGQYVVRDGSAGTWVCGVVGGCAPGGTDALIDSPAEGLILVREGGTVAAERVRLGDAESAVMRVSSRRERVDLDVDGPLVVEVRPASGTAGVRIEGAAAPPLSSPGASLAFAPRGGEAAEVWGSGVDDTDVRVIPRALRAGATVVGADGERALTLPPRGVVEVTLPGPRQVRVDLGGGSFAATVDGRGAWAETAPTSLRLREAQGAVWIGNPTDREVLARVEILPATASGALMAGLPHEELQAAAETWSLTVPPAPGRLEIRGARRATYARTDGAIGVGTSFEVASGGVLTLNVEPGPVLAWVEAPGAAGPTRAVPSGPSVPVAGSGAVPLSGSVARLTLRPPAPSAITLRAPCPLVATVKSGPSPRVVVADTGDRVDVWVADPARGVEVELRALAGAALFGELATSRSAPTALAEGLGPEVLLGPGGSSWFSFAVARDGTVGFGARADAERVDAVLHDAAGVELARGIVGSRELSPGTYLLSLSQPPGTPPVRARPVVVGLVAPPTTPPEDVVKSYLPAGTEGSR